MGWIELVRRLEAMQGTIVVICGKIAGGKFAPGRAAGSVVLLLTLGLICGCLRPPASDETSSNSNTQKLPFDRHPKSSGVSPEQVLVPAARQLPEGTPIPVHLKNALSSAWSHAGDAFNAIIDEPVVVDGQTLIAAGTPAEGRVLEATPAVSTAEPGYLRIVLVSVNAGSPVTIETSSIFAKGGGAGGSAKQVGTTIPRDNDIVFGTDRRLNFRLAQTVDLQ